MSLQRIFVLLCLITFPLHILGPMHALGQSYRYIDDAGNIHFVDRVTEVPKKYQNQLEGIPPTPAVVQDDKGKRTKKKDSDREREREREKLERERKKLEKQQKREREKHAKAAGKIQRNQKLLPRYEDSSGLPQVPVAQPMQPSNDAPRDPNTLNPMNMPGFDALKPDVANGE